MTDSCTAGCRLATEGVSGHTRCTCPCHRAEGAAQGAAALEVYADDSGASHTADRCKWKPSVIYPGHEACVVNGAAHYRAAQGAAAPPDAIYADIRRDIRAAQVQIAEATWRLGRDHPEFHALQRGLSMLNRLSGEEDR